MRASRLLVDVGPLRESRSLRTVVVARTVSIVALGLLSVAIPFEVHRATGSVLWVTVATLGIGGAGFGGVLVGGMLADRVERRRLLVGSRLAATALFAVLCVGSLALPVAAGGIRGTAGLALVLMVGALNSFAASVSNAVLGAMLPDLDAGGLSTVSSLLAGTGNVGAVVAPVIAGVGIAAGGPPLVYGVGALVVAVSWLAARSLPRFPPITVPPGGAGSIAAGAAPARELAEPVRGGVRQGLLGYLRGAPVLVGLLVLAGLVRLSDGVLVLLPSFADQRLGGSPVGLGVLYAAPAIGVLAAVLVSGWMDGARLAVAWAAAAGGIAAVAVAGLGSAHTLPSAVVLLAVSGAGGMIGTVLVNTALLELCDARFRGRVVGAWTAVVTVAPGAASALCIVAGEIPRRVTAGLDAVTIGPALVGTAACIALAAVVLGIPELRRFGRGSRRGARRPQRRPTSVPAAFQTSSPLPPAPLHAPGLPPAPSPRMEPSP